MSETNKEISFDQFIEELDQIDLVPDPHKTAKIFQRLRDFAKQSQVESQVVIAQLELEAFSFVLLDGQACHQFEFETKEGSRDRFPDIKRYTEVELGYLEGRCSNSKNPYLRLRYAQILWSSIRKNLTFAKSAVDSSIAILTGQSEQIEKQKDLPEDQTFVPIAKNAFYLSKLIKYRNDEVCEKIAAAVRDASRGGPLAMLRFQLLNFMVEEQKSFVADSFKDTDDHCYTYAENSLNPHEAIDFLKLGETISRKFGRHSSKWQMGIGQQYEILLNSAEERNDLVMTDFCLSAIEAYRLCGAETKVDELTRRFDIIKTKPILSSSSVPLDQDAYNKHVQDCKKRADLLLGHESNRVFAFLTNVRSIIPNVAELRELGATQRVGQFLFGHVPCVTQDNRGHVAKHWVEDDELAEFSLWFNYQFDLKFDKCVQIGTIVTEGISRGIITIDSVLEFLKDSWFGQPLMEKLGKSEFRYLWQDQFRPALELYFAEVQKASKDPNYVPQVMLAVDSLVMKFEGILRDLLFRTNQIPTFKIKLDSKKRKIVRARDIIEILNDTSINKILTDDEIYFLKYILVEHAGWNLRGEIAHGLMFKDFYSLTQMNLLFVALLKLSKFKLTVTDSAKASEQEVEYEEPDIESSEQE